MRSNTKVSMSASLGENVVVAAEGLAIPIRDCPYVRGGEEEPRKLIFGDGYTVIHEA
jgi:hypothetical protein